MAPPLSSTPPPRDPLERLSRLARWLRTLDERIWRSPGEATRGVKAFARRWLQILDRSLRGFITNRSYTKASALTYTTLITVVPLLAILLAVLTGFDVQDHVQDALKRMPEAYLLRAAPDAGAQAAGDQVFLTMWEDALDGIFVYVNETNIGNLGVIGLCGFLLSVLTLMWKIESAMNDAWAVHRSRPLARKLADYMNLMLVLLLILVGMSTTATGQASGLLEKIGMGGPYRLVLRLFPYLIVWFAFVFLNFYMPNTRVAWKSAFAGGCVSGTLFQVAQVLFLGATQLMMTRYNKIYGAFASILIFWMWIYLSWCILLWGVEIGCAHQNLREWRRRRRPWFNTPIERETLALRMAALLAAPLLPDSGRQPMDAGDLADELELPSAPIGEMIELFRAEGLTIQSAENGTYLLARSPETLSVRDVLRLARQGALTPPPAGVHVLDDLSATANASLQSMTVRDLVARPLDEIHSFSF